MNYSGVLMGYLTLCHQLFTFMPNPPLPHHAESIPKGPGKAIRSQRLALPQEQEAQNLLSKAGNTSGVQETAVSTLPHYKEQNHLLDVKGKTQTGARRESRLHRLTKVMPEPPGSSSSALQHRALNQNLLLSGSRQRCREAVPGEHAPLSLQQSLHILTDW